MIPTAANRRAILWMALPISTAVALSVSRGTAQETQEPATVTVTGNVVDETTGEPVPGVIIVVAALDISFFTDADGKFVIADVPRGSYSLEVIHRDYQQLEGDLAIDRPGEFFLGLTPIQDPNDGMITGIVGVVTDQVSGEPIPEVVVNVPTVGRAATTAADGRFVLPDLVPGRQELVFSHLGYQRRAETIEVQAGHATNVQVALTVDAIELDPIEVTVDRRDRNLERAGFYQRQEEGWGHFVDRDDMENWNPIDLTDALIRFPGVSIVPDAQRPMSRHLRFRRSRGACEPRVYLDGVLLTGLEGFFLDDVINPVSVAGVEMYRGVAGIPAQYSGRGTSCGVVLIWLRRGG